MKVTIYDKAAWHIDAGEKTCNVLKHFEFIMSWCSENALLSDDGKEIHELGADESISLHSGMFTDKGNNFMTKYYDEFINATENDKITMCNKLNSL